MSNGSEINNCPYCGSAIELKQEFCHNCGANLQELEASNLSSYTLSPSSSYSTSPSTSYTPTQSTSYTQYPRQSTTYVPPKRSDDSSGVIALIFGVLACTGILPCIGSLVAIIVGGNAKNEGSSTGQIGFILGWISCCIPIVFFIFFLFFGMW